MEGFFKFLFGLAVVIAALTVIGIFLLICKVILMFQPQIYIMGLVIS
jgi:hypothetical protein